MKSSSNKIFNLARKNKRVLKIKIPAWEKARASKKIKTAAKKAHSCQKYKNKSIDTSKTTEN